MVYGCTCVGLQPFENILYAPSNLCTSSTRVRVVFVRCGLGGRLHNLRVRPSWTVRFVFIPSVAGALQMQNRKVLKYLYLLNSRRENIGWKTIRKIENGPLFAIHERGLSYRFGKCAYKCFLMADQILGMLKVLKMKKCLSRGMFMWNLVLWIIIGVVCVYELWNRGYKYLLMIFLYLIDYNYCIHNRCWVVLSRQ